ncbi:hypothetical protein RM572_00430 [Streptomyces sp. DSM 42041]|uniref:Uncharacterized protein n=1 Tax=Streptomyces hazeniae TaxID=3075538 RepID=A0ABU2NL92_9ACTN|nr:hypothetical protein [Streptomyces sp. DSM 42041]MDT0377242.1 hypothetical protein [Streptomyces sp. DSM 42041]
MPRPDICPDCGEDYCAMSIPLLDRPEAVTGCFNHLSHDVTDRKPYPSLDAWRAALQEFVVGGSDSHVVEVTEELRRLEQSQDGAARPLADGPLPYSGSAADHSIRTYTGPLAVCPACIQPLGKHVFALGAGYSWQHFPEQWDGVDCPRYLDHMHDGQVLRVNPDSEALSSLRAWYPDCSAKD